jgi:NTP pyrophosphatase (non-canonical NTP hydrolase)
MSDADLYRRAFVCWGIAAQWRMLQEECGELIAAVNRCDRGRIEPWALASEIADVEIMLEQARLMLDSDMVERVKAEKLARLRERIEQAEGNSAEGAKVEG